MPLNKEEKQKKSAKKATKTEESLKPITMWAVIDNADPDNPVTFTATRKEAIIALDQYLFLKHYKHFRVWCPIHGYKVDHGEAWKIYSRTVMSLEYNGESLYTLAEVDYNPAVIASLLRAYNRCVPMGCPFDTDEELNDYSAYLAEKSDRVEAGEDTFTPIEEALELLFEDIEKEDCTQCDEFDCPANPNYEGNPTDTPDDNSSNSCPHGKRYDA